VILQSVCLLVAYAVVRDVGAKGSSVEKTGVDWFNCVFTLFTWQFTT